MHRRLSELDPEISERIHPNDPQRIQRALEVIEITGRKMSELQNEQEESQLGYDVLKIVACPEPRALLHQRIDQRWDLLRDEGFMQDM